MADAIYRNKENRRFCKEHGIRLSGPRLGRPKAAEIEADKEQAYRDSCDRNIVENRSSPNDVEQAFLGGYELAGSPPQDHSNQIVNIEKTEAEADDRFDNIVWALRYFKWVT